MRIMLRDARLLVEAATLDVFDLNFELGSGKIRWSSSEPAALPRKGVATRIGSFFLHFFKSLVATVRGQRAAAIPRRAFLCVAVAKNERDALEPICSKLPSSYLTGSGVEARNDFPLVWAYVLSLPYLPLVVKAFLRATGFRRRSFLYTFDGYWRTYGLYVVARMWLRGLEPRAVILANQLALVHRVIARAARDEGIATFYVPHASVPENIPPLTFDFALLDGYDALSKYARAGTSSTKVFLVGVPKHDRYVQHLHSEGEVGSVGVCTNQLDPFGSCEQLCARLRSAFPTMQLVVRPHPSDRRRRAWKSLSTKYDMDFSRCEAEAPFDFLGRVGAIIAGDSNILLEAALMNVVPLYYDFSNTHEDWYGFHRHGLVEYFSDPEGVCQFLAAISHGKPAVRTRAKRYCVTVGSRYDGRSSELASAVIEHATSAGRWSGDGWKRIPGIELEAYEPDDSADLGLPRDRGKGRRGDR